MDILNWRLKRKEEKEEKEEKNDTEKKEEKDDGINGNWRIPNIKHQSKYKSCPLSSSPYSSFYSPSFVSYSPSSSFKNKERKKTPGFENFNKSKSFNFEKKYRKIIPSYGIIALTITQNNTLEFCISQKKDTIPYSEFLRNKLDEKTLPELIPFFSKQEKKRIITCYNENRLEDLYEDFWSNKKVGSVEKIKELIEKYYELFDNDTIGLDENPWEFPKGRKHHHENNIRCAIREWEEETKMSEKDLTVITCRPYIENYKGYNGKNYKSIYYLAIMDYDKVCEYVENIKYKSSQFRQYITEETQDIKWLSREEAKNKLDDSKNSILSVIEKFLTSKGLNNIRYHLYKSPYQKLLHKKKTEEHT